MTLAGNWEVVSSSPNTSELFFTSWQFDCFKNNSSAFKNECWYACWVGILCVNLSKQSINFVQFSWSFHKLRLNDVCMCQWFGSSLLGATPLPVPMIRSKLNTRSGSSFKFGELQPDDGLRTNLSEILIRTHIDQSSFAKMHFKTLYNFHSSKCNSECHLLNVCRFVLASRWNVSSLCVLNLPCWRYVYLPFGGGGGGGGGVIHYKQVAMIMSLHYIITHYLPTLFA